MDNLTEDLGFITEEQLDFTFGSPVSDSNEQANQEVEEEVFVGAVKHVERCVAKNLDLNAREGVGRASPGPPHWTPLSTEKFEEVCREANRLARQLEKLALKENLEQSPLVTALIRAQEPRRSPRRETYVVKDSPVRLLLPDVSLEGISLLSLNEEEGLASPTSPVNNVSDTPTADGATPTKRKITPKVCKTTPVVRNVTHVTNEVKPTARTSTAVKAMVTPTTGEIAPATKKTTPTAHASKGTPKRGSPVTSPKKEVTPMKSRAKASNGPAAMPATGQAVLVTSLQRQCRKPGQGIGRGQRSNDSSAALHPGNGSQDKAAAAIRPSLTHRTLGAKKNLKAVCNSPQPVAPTSQVSSMGRPAASAKVKMKPLARSFSGTQATHAGPAHVTKPSQGSKHQTTSTAFPRPVLGWSAPKGRSLTSDTGVSRLPVYHGVPVAQLRSSQSVSRGDDTGHKKGAEAVSQ
ncbi:proline/serine-rich coiled-coil protein 1-like [Brienomyrus brachyistius]|uniref:proline/serine-rich coiled-coil protein 1-like n=1 Tax=Brienomyrus brachyistius TaxID=42636 RepID=UPI0020B35332|nr:proline/serine-rich coiled-coil protein 1-like [Brienomyrus brachyistius]XP_048872496.1 proline/serine-rich coiled-coil protein 1-like [Brienomyrus brachyistius]